MKCNSADAKVDLKRDSLKTIILNIKYDLILELWKFWNYVQQQIHSRCI